MGESSPEPYDDDAELHAEWARQAQEFRLEQWRKRIPPSMRTPGELDPRIVSWVNDLVRRSPNNLLMVGPVGVGKTWSCWHAADAAIAAGWDGDPTVVGAYEWKLLITPPVNEMDVRDIARSSLLVLDDPGAMRLGAWELEHMYGVIDYRWNHRLPTIITSNVPDLRAMLGERIASRLAANVTVVVLDGPDRRREGK
ncbi:ATP-binding protein [Nonomuraea sp. NPDC049269]|uniref:ATP-binding protein n=1 Tax=Nonomuraea sp. NPDC049269 TaxID=3364349 RepID=UPI00371D5A5C